MTTQRLSDLIIKHGPYYGDPCTPDYRGDGCETHSWRPSSAAERCPDARAQELLARWRGDA